MKSDAPLKTPRVQRRLDLGLQMRLALHQRLEIMAIQRQQTRPLQRADGAGAGAVVEHRFFGEPWPSTSMMRRPEMNSSTRPETTMYMQSSCTPRRQIVSPASAMRERITGRSSAIDWECKPREQG